MTKKEEEQVVQVPQSVLTQLQKQLTDLEVRVEEANAKNAGLEELFRTADTVTEPQLRQKKSFTPKFHTVRLRKFPIAGDYNNQGIVVGWDARGAYQEVDRNGVTPMVVEFLNIKFLGQEKLEKVRLLDLINNSTQIVCKVLEEKKETKIVETGEEMDATEFDTAHGTVGTGEKVDGFYTYADMQYLVQIPGEKDTWIDAKYLNR